MGRPPDPGKLREITERRVRLRDTGWHVIPVYGPDAKLDMGAGKRPAGTNWQQLEDTSPAEIRGWAARYPDATNTGLLTRWFPVVDIDVLDPDLSATIQRMAREMLGRTPLTRIGQPPKAAMVYRTDTPFGKRKVGWTGANAGAVEILGHGQQLVIDGEHPGTRRAFYWLDHSILDVTPDDIPAVTDTAMDAFIRAVEAEIERLGLPLVRRRDDEASRGPAGATPTAVIEGARNSTLSSLAGTMRRRGLGEAAILAALRVHNREHCRPPLDDAEVRKIAWSIARYEPDAVDAHPVAPGGGPAVPGRPAMPSGAELIARGRIDDLLDDPAPAVPMLLRGLLPEGVVGTLVGTGGVGKTTLLVDMAMSLAGGKTFLDFGPVAPTRTLLLVKEDDRSDLHRMVQHVVAGPEWHAPGDALANGFVDRGLMMERMRENLRVASLVGHATHLITSPGAGRAEVGAFYEYLREVIDACNQESGEALRCLILDPASRFRNANENDNNAATMLVELLEGVRDEFGCTILLSHHTGKIGDVMDQHSARGASAFVDGMRWASMVAPVPGEMVERLGLDPRDQLVMLGNTKNTKMPRAPAMVLRRLPDAGFESLGTVAALAGEAEAAAESEAAARDRRHADVYEVTIGPLVDLVRAAVEAGRPVTVKQAADVFGGRNGPLGVGKDTVRTVVEVAIETGALEVRETGRRGAGALFPGPQAPG